MPTFTLLTFGCKTNQYESQGIRESLQAGGYTEVDSIEAASVCVVNTCSVTGRADAEARKTVRALHRKNPQARIVLTGCMADLDREDVTQLDGIALVIPNAEKHTLVARLANDPITAEADRFAFSISAFAGHTRAFIKIQDGCANFCSYCTVPYARGMPQSRPLASVLEEARALVGNGYTELVLTGINLGDFRDGEVDLGGLIRRLGETPGLLRLRCGSVEPPAVTDRLLTAIRDTAPACPHLHIPLQSGDDAVLRAMNRRYTTTEFTDVVERARVVLDEPGITTDVIVGLPGEDERSFEASRALIEDIGFSRTHVFLFSPRPGTPAADLPQKTPQREITARRNRLLQTAEASATAFAACQVGREVQMIVEESKEEGHSGYTDRYLRMHCRGTNETRGGLVRARVTDHDGALLLGTGLENPPPAR